MYRAGGAEGQAHHGALQGQLKLPQDEVEIPVSQWDQDVRQVSTVIKYLVLSSSGSACTLVVLLTWLEEPPARPCQYI